MHNPGRNVALALAVAGLPSALVGRWSVLVSEPHCVKERESDSEPFVGQNIWRLESLVKQVGDFASSGKVDTVTCGEEPTRVFPGAVFEILRQIGGGLATQLILAVVQKLRTAIPDAQGRMVARLMTACVVAVEEMAFFRVSKPAHTWTSSPRISLPTTIIIWTHGECGVLAERRLRLQRCLWCCLAVLIGLDR